MVLLALIFIVPLTISLANIFFPRRVWGLFKSWRFRNPDAVEPSELVVLWYRAGGVVGVILVVVVGVNTLTDYRRHARCEELLPELKSHYATGGISAVEQRAGDLGLEVKDLTYGGPVRLGRIVVTDEGKPFATIWASAPDAYCNV